MQERKKRYTVLEYYKVTEMLSERAISSGAKQSALNLEPTSDLTEIEKNQAETAEAVSVCLRKGTPPFTNTAKIEEPVTYAEKGGSISMKQLIEINVALSTANRVRSFLRSDIPEALSIKRLSESLSIFQDIETTISNSIISDTEMSDSASSVLKNIRRNISIQNEKIRSSLSKYVTSSAYDDVLMDKLITMRNDRFVIPVKQEAASKFPGIVHDRSKGGATVFIEPQIVVDMNNKLRELQLEEASEIERILAEISGEIGMVAEEIRNNQRILARLDFIFAKANLACDMKADKPTISEDGKVEIINARNPLIDSDVVVPISITFGGDERILIVTGPNTGGKTVTLKTVGLFILMAKAGLHVPASRSIIPNVNNVFADIGDEQSIEQSLSTFSSHMKNIVELLADTDEDSIVLLDELGAGTDPAEGAALAISILETLRAKNCLAMATTHYTELKKYAIATEGVENASMEFDISTLSPTYRVLMGNPGRSNAFEISRKLGLPDEIIDKAKYYLDNETIAFDDVMTEIEQDRKAAISERQETERLRKSIEEKENELSEKLGKIDKKKEEILSKAKIQAMDTIEEASEYAEVVRAELKEIIKEARNAGNSDGYADLLRRADDERKTLRNLDADYKSKIEEAPKNEKPGKKLDASKIEIGSRVKIVSTGINGEVLTLPDEKGRLTVLAGALKMSVKIDDLLKIEDGKSKKSSGSSGRYAKIVRTKMDSISPSIDLHGKNLDEAEMLVDKYLDNALLAGLNEVSINHGRGEGVLKNGIRRMLKGHKHVTKFRPGRFDEGGEGVTIVTLSNK